MEAKSEHKIKFKRTIPPLKWGLSGNQHWFLKRHNLKAETRQIMDPNSEVWELISTQSVIFCTLWLRWVGDEGSWVENSRKISSKVLH